MPLVGRGEAGQATGCASTRLCDDDSPRNKLKPSSDRASISVPLPYLQVGHSPFPYQMPIYLYNGHGNPRRLTDPTGFPHCLLGSPFL